MLAQHHISLASRALAIMMVCAVFLYLINNYLVYWQGLPGTFNLLSYYQFMGLEPLDSELKDNQITQAWVQLTIYLCILLAGIAYVLKTNTRTLLQDSQRYARLSAYIIRLSFWSVVLIGTIDMLISFLRVEDMLEFFTGEWLGQQLGRPIFRGTFVHYPLSLLYNLLY